MKFLKAFLVAFFTVYMAGAFVSTEFNINKWKKDDRTGVVFISFIVAVVVSV